MAKSILSADVALFKTRYRRGALLKTPNIGRTSPVFAERRTVGTAWITQVVGRVAECPTGTACAAWVEAFDGFLEDVVEAGCRGVAEEAVVGAAAACVRGLKNTYAKGKYGGGEQKAGEKTGGVNSESVETVRDE